MILFLFFTFLSVDDFIQVQEAKKKHKMNYMSNRKQAVASVREKKIQILHVY